MNKIVLLILSLALGGFAGYYFGYDVAWEKALTDHNHDETQTHVHHEQIEAPSPVPSVDLLVHKDPKSGWNAQIKLINFRFAPEGVSSADVPGEGHAHIYVDGVKVNRVYSEWYHLGELSPGAHEVSVRISTNDHKELVTGGEPITDVEIVNVEEAGDAAMEDDSMMMDHNSMMEME